MKWAWAAFACALLLLLCCGTALADDSGICGSSLYWRFDSSEGELIITGQGAMTDYYTYSRVPWYKYRSEIRSVTMDDINCHMTHIGDNAFYGCGELVSFDIPDGVAGIGQNAFYGCKKLSRVTIPGSVNTVGKAAFRECGSLKRLTVPYGVNDIGEYAFAFSGLTEAAVPETAREVPANAFYGCSALTGISVVGENGYFSSQGGVLFDKAGTKLIAYPAGKAGSYTVPAGVTQIGEMAFAKCSGLTGVAIPSGVTVIEQDAFMDCTSLTAVTIPDSVAVIASGAFKYSGLRSVTVPAGVTDIGPAAFSYCADLAGVSLPDGMTAIPDSLFEGCESLARAEIPAGVTEIGLSAFSGCGKLTDAAIPAGVVRIGSCAFMDCALAGVTIPAGTAEIGEAAFMRCGSLADAVILSRKVQIGEDAFGDCSAELVICGWAGSTAQAYAMANSISFEAMEQEVAFFLPARLTAIEDETFSGIEAEVVVIPAGVKRISGDPFAGSNVTTIRGVPGSAAEEFAQEKGYLFVPVDR